MTTSEAINAAFDKFGDDASNAQIEDFLKTKGIKPGTGFASQISRERKKRRPASEGLNIDKLSRLKELLGGNPEQFLSLVLVVEEAVNLVGGFDELRRAAKLFTK